MAGGMEKVTIKWGFSLVIALANQAGLRLSPRQMFLTPTVGGLAAAAGKALPIRAEQGIVVGSVPLTPIQRWFFDRWEPHMARWNQSNLLSVTEPLDADTLRSTLQALMEHHDALRLRFRKSESGWEQKCEDLTDTVPFEWEDFSDLADDECSRTIEERASHWQGSLDVTDGPLVRVVCFHLGHDRPDRLLFVAHHLVVDAVSWPVLLEDFQSVYGQLAAGATNEGSTCGTVRGTSLEK